MSIMIAIHNRLGSFSDRWIEYCKYNNIPYKIVNCYDSSIISHLQECDGLMWHWSHNDYRAQNFARQLIVSVEKMGIRVFPSFDTCWHFDDKVGQKYLLESLGAQSVRSYTFYKKDEAVNWLNNTELPKVFKLRGGAGSMNVMLIKSKQDGLKVINTAFSKGFPLVARASSFQHRLWILKRDKNLIALNNLLKGFIRVLLPPKGLDMLPRQKGYVYFQDFIANNDYDDRVVVVGNKAFALRRYVRKNDFRASGSGMFAYEPSLFNLETIRIAFEVYQQINAQSLAFDFIYDRDSKPLIVEISYAYSMGSAYDNCKGYWDKELKWHEVPVNPQLFIVEDFINLINEKK